MHWFDIIKAYGSNTAKTNEQLMATLKEMGYDVNSHPMFKGRFNPAVANYIIQNEGKGVKRPIQQMGQDKPKPNLPKPVQKPISPKPSPPPPSSKGIPLPKPTPPPPQPPKKKLPSQKTPQLPASVKRRSSFQNVLNQPKKIVTTEKDLVEGARLAAQRQQQSVNQQSPQPIKNNNVATTQSTPLPANIQRQRRQQQYRQQQPQQQQQQQKPANAQQKKKLSDKVKATLQRRKMGKNQKIVDRQRKEMLRMMTPEQRREYQLEEARQNPNKPVTQG